MREAGVVIDLEGRPIFWHVPAGRSAGALPDSRLLWDVLWENRERLLGFAHTHPGGGEPRPSGIDVSTFEAIEAALGKRLVWWIATSDELRAFRHAEGEYRGEALAVAPEWLAELNERSK